jgi:PAS domain S-box-containing protein
MVTSPLLDIDGQVSGVVVLIEDVTTETEALEQVDLLDQAIDQASEAVLITDLDARIVYANPASLEISGYALHDVIGQNPRKFKSGAHDGAFYADLWSTVTDGRPWHGVLVNRAADGTLYEQDTTISPVTDGDGKITSYVSVARDLARERALEADLEGERAERRMVTEALALVRRGATAAATALDLCDAVIHIEAIQRAAVLRESPDGLLHLLAVRSRDGASALPETFDADASRALRLRAALGAWSSSIGDIDMPVALAAAAHGTATVAIGGAPIEWEGKNLGVLLCASSDTDAERRLGQRTTTLTAVATHAAALLGPQLADIGDREAAEQRISAVIERGAFHPVFQPVFDIRTREIVGYEALTRFDDGTRPDLVFAEAHRAGLGTRLEAACIRAAIAESEGRIGGAWLSVNASPELTLDGSLAAVLGVGHELVLEVTEHVEISDYLALRDAIDAIEGLRVAVDDAGAGYASLRHILELRPDFVKLDIALIRGIESDPARQAMVASMRHFAEATGTTLLAEGIETDAELQTWSRWASTSGRATCSPAPGRSPEAGSRPLSRRPGRASPRTSPGRRDRPRRPPTPPASPSRGRCSG